MFETGERTTQHHEQEHENLDDQPAHQPAGVVTNSGADPGTFTSASYTHVGLTRRYKLYTPPATTTGRPTALVVMLHGCTQNPDVFAAVGVHSGLPSGAAGNMAEALMLMKNGGANGMNSGMGRARLGAKPLVHQSVPTIIFHGDQDQTVHPRNGEQVLAAVLANQTGSDGSTPGAAPAAQVEQGVSPRGRRYTRSTYCNASGAPLAEHWVLHGAGHAWSGGLASGSYTDATGPDATREMVRFFFSQPGGQAH